MNSDKIKKDVPWKEVQDELAEKSGLAVVLTDRPGLGTVAESNNSSICRTLTGSEEFAPRCRKYCGRVYENAVEAGKPLKFKCHAGLECIAVPLEGDGDRKLVAITGRAFTGSEDYRKATERAIAGDWSGFPPTRFFENVLLTGSPGSLEELAREVSEKASGGIALPGQDGDGPAREKTGKKTARSRKEPSDRQDRQDQKPAGIKTEPKTTDTHASVRPETPARPVRPAPAKRPDKGRKAFEKRADEARELAEWRSLFTSLLDLGYREACRSVLKFLQERYRISSLAWLENSRNRLRKVHALGALETQEIQISLELDDERFINLFRTERSIELRERNRTGSEEDDSQRLRMFPIIIGGEIQSALVIGERAGDERLAGSIARFCRAVAAELEILRLREELSKRSWLDTALAKFNESLKMIDSEDFWSRLMETTAELLQAERGSLLVFDEKTRQLTAKAAIGRRAESIKTAGTRIGAKIAGHVWQSGEPLVVPSISETQVRPAPPEWLYKTESFISVPISIGERRIGVLNLADKVDGSPYGEFDLRLLQSVAPQIAVAIDHATLKNKAGEFEQLSVTDPLTGLLNRRYLEERLAEEINRSNRHGYPMSFMMIDVDDFKSYNDEFLHPEGDKALQIVGQGLRESLRGADIAARYGGEEFSILLPQTTLDEAEIIAERIRTNIETTRFPNRQVTVSIGIACISLTVDTVEELIEAADKALFEAKTKGKNNVTIYAEQRQEMLLPN